MNLIDNINTRLGDELKKDMERGNKISVAASYFIRTDTNCVDITFILDANKKHTPL